MTTNTRISEYTDPLRSALLANAGFSTLSGLLLAVAPETVGGWLGVVIDGWLRALGLALLGHAVVLVLASRQDDIHRWGWLNFVAIAPYPLAMIALAVTGAVPRDLGKALVLIDGTIVGLLAAAQWLGLRSPKRQQLQRAV